MLYMYDTVLEQIKQHIGDCAPERGGALLGEPGKNVVTDFVFDETAFTTSSTYSPSRKLNKEVRKAEQCQGLEYKGIIHSHPGSYNHPSMQDLTELETGLRLNEHMPYYMVPIVTIDRFGKHHELKKNELAIDHMKVTFYAGYRTEEHLQHQGDTHENRNANDSLVSRLFRKKVTLEKMEVALIPKGRLRKDMEGLCQLVIGVINPNVFIVDYDNQPMLAGSVEVDGLFDLLILVDITYPHCHPKLLITYSSGEQTEIQAKWNENEPFMDQLEAIISALIDKNKRSNPINIASQPATPAPKSEISPDTPAVLEPKFISDEQSATTPIPSLNSYTTTEPYSKRINEKTHPANIQNDVEIQYQSIKVSYSTEGIKRESRTIRVSKKYAQDQFKEE